LNNVIPNEFAGLYDPPDDKIGSSSVDTEEKS